jgi:4-hydroxy-tetrahydrodipicolinate synthase
LTLPLLSVGGGGVISVAANLIPGHLVKFFNLWEAGDIKEARTLFFRMLPFFRAMFLETNPIPVKHALSLTGRIGPETRLPLTLPSPPVREKLQALLQEWELA